MDLFAELCDAIAGTTKKNEKTRILAAYLRSRTPEEAAVSAVFLSGRAFPAWEETTLQVGGQLLWRVIMDITGHQDQALTAAYRRTGDLGAATAQLLESQRKSQPKGSAAERHLNVLQVTKTFRLIAAAHGPVAKANLLRDMFARATPLEVKYLIKVITGELRIGLKESLVEEAIATGYGDAVRDVQRANMLLGDIGETLRLAAEHRLGEARMRLFHPIGFMLASPAQDAGEAFESFQHAVVEDKYDGIRAQAHVSDGRVRLFSRTLDDVVESFPELVDPLAAFPDDIILDGEILAWNFAGGKGRALPFSQLQQRLGRKRVTAAMTRSVPVAYVVFDLLYVGGELVIDKPLRERSQMLDDVFLRLTRSPRKRTGRAANIETENPQGVLVFEPAVVTEQSQGADVGPGQSAVIRAPSARAESAEQLEDLFLAAQARGNEGLMVKDAESVYTPGRRGRSWLKLKRELATLDVVVTRVEWGHGKRISVLSDYTFAVRDRDRLVNVGKAYSGLTDAEIAQLTPWFLEHTLADHGFSCDVEPNVVLEVAFNAIMISDRHNSGFALRFPRILRVRTDKPVEEIDTLDRVREIYERQHHRTKAA
jgi:DNA ligase-1